MAALKYTILSLLVCFGVSLAGQLCYTDSGTEWCDWGCCTYDTDDDDYDYFYRDSYEHCCEDNETVAIIVGAVVGSIAFIAIISTIIVIVCCCMRKSRGRQGGVFGGAGAVSNPGAYPMQYCGASVTTSAYPAQPYPAAPIQTGNIVPGTQPWSEPPKYEGLNTQQANQYETLGPR